jgi:hypothetical protein
LWQVLQLMISLAERRGSKNKSLPSSTFSCVTALPLTAGTTDGIGLKASNASFIRSSSARTGAAERASTVAIAPAIVRFIRIKVYIDRALLDEAYMRLQ